MRQNIISTPLDESFREIFSDIPYLNVLIGNGVTLAGGLLRTLISQTEVLSPEKTDIDLFFEFPKMVALVKEFIEKTEEFEKIFECPEEKLTTYKHTKTGWKLQLITVNYYKSPVEVISSFDFTCTMFATDGNKLYMGETSIEDTMEKRLRWNVITYPASSLRRMMKYARKGYWMMESDYQEFVHEVWTHSPDISDSQLVYVD